MCTRTFCMWLHSFDTLSCPYLQLKTVSSWDDSLTSILTRDTFVWRYTYTYIYIQQHSIRTDNVLFQKNKRLGLRVKVHDSKFNGPHRSSHFRVESSATPL